MQKGLLYNMLLRLGKCFFLFPLFFIAVSYTHLDVYKRQDLTCIIKNKYGKVEMSTSFSSNLNFSKGFFYVACLLYTSRCV